MGETDFKMLLSTHIVKQIIAPQIKMKTRFGGMMLLQKAKKKPEQKSFQNLFTKPLQHFENQLGKDVNSWTWNKVHTLEHQHPLGKVAALRGFLMLGLLKFQDLMK